MTLALCAAVTTLQSSIFEVSTLLVVSVTLLPRRTRLYDLTSWHLLWAGSPHLRSQLLPVSNGRHRKPSPTITLLLYSYIWLILLLSFRVICESTANDLTEVMGGPTYPAGGGGPVSSLLVMYSTSCLNSQIIFLRLGTTTWWWTWGTPERTPGPWCPPSGRRPPSVWCTCWPWRCLGRGMTQLVWHWDPGPRGPAKAKCQPGRNWPLLMTYYSIAHNTDLPTSHLFRFMENREPYQIRGLMLVYNLFQTIFSFWMFLEGWSFYMTGEYNWVCQPVDYSDSPGAKRALSLAWWYYFSKARMMIVSKTLHSLSDFHSLLTWLTPSSLLPVRSSPTSLLSTSSTTALCPGSAGGDPGSWAGDRAASDPSSTLWFTPSCTFTISSPPVTSTSISGGKDISQRCRWFSLFWYSCTPSR